MSRAELLRIYGLALASGVLLGSLAGSFVPIEGYAALYIIGDTAWRALRKVAPHPDQDRERS